MGLELKQCKAVIKAVKATGKLHVDSKQIEFRAKDVRWSVQVGKGTSAKVDGNKLVVRRGSKTATFDVGAKAEKWADKVVNPPTRATKLGLKSGSKVLLRGGLEDSFAQELSAHGLVSVKSVKTCDIAFVKLNKAADFKVFDSVASSCATGVHIWAIWPKGIEAVGQGQVIGRAREHGMGPGKKISFDETCTAMRFTKK